MYNVLKVDEIPSDYQFLPGNRLSIKEYTIDESIDLFIVFR